MKSIAYLMTSMLAFSGYAFADHKHAYICLEMTETLVKIEQDAQCKILQHPGRKQQYPDVNFLAEQNQQTPLFTCVKGQANGKLGGISFTASSISGIISYSDPLFSPTGEVRLPFTAATILKLKFRKYQAELYLRDSSQLIDPSPISQGNALEELYVIGGTKIFNGAKGTLKIKGPEFTGADVTGTVCVNPNKANKHMSEL